MKFPYHVTHNGIDYEPFEEVPMGESKKVVETVVEEEPVKAEPKLTKTDINRMPINELKELADKVGIKDLNTKTGSDLKKELIKKLNL